MNRSLRHLGWAGWGLLGLAGCGMLPSGESARQPPAAAEPAESERDRQRQEAAREREASLDRIIRQYAGRPGATFWDGDLVIHAGTRTGDRFRGEVLVSLAETAGRPPRCECFVAASATVSGDQVLLDGFLGARDREGSVKIIPRDAGSSARIDRDGSFTLLWPDARGSMMMKLSRPRPSS